MNIVFKDSSMRTIHSIQEWQSIQKEITNKGPIGLVMTMGNLHEGHASLLKKARAENLISILSIFINPAQFNDKKDLENYPKTIEQDLVLAAEHGVDYVFIPSSEEMYADNYRYKITEHEVSHILEGKHRPGHFDGVLTIVLKVFSLIKPQRAYFGEKDYQQLQLIKGMVDAFFLEIDIIPCPTVRLDSGLPFSSRNNLLEISELKKLEAFSQCLFSGKSANAIEEKLLSLGFKVDYVAEWQNRLFAAIKVGNVRLIDNIAISSRDPDNDNKKPLN